MNSGSIARRYARALLKIGVDSGRLDQFSAELDRFSEAMRVQPLLMPVLGNPTYGYQRRRAVLEDLTSRLNVAGVVRSLLLLLLDRSRLVVFPEIARAYAEFVDEHQGQVRAQVTSVAELDAETKRRLTDALEQSTGKRVMLSTRSDASLIAGIVTQIGSIVYDGSVQTRLAAMREHLATGS